jgi:hypothetical protein
VPVARPDERGAPAPDSATCGGAPRGSLVADAPRAPDTPPRLARPVTRSLRRGGPRTPGAGFSPPPASHPAPVPHPLACSQRLPETARTPLSNRRRPILGCRPRQEDAVSASQSNRRHPKALPRSCGVSQPALGCTTRSLAPSPARRSEHAPARSVSNSRGPCIRTLDTRTCASRRLSPCHPGSRIRVRPKNRNIRLARISSITLVLALSTGLVLAGDWPQEVAKSMGLPSRTDGALEVRIWVGGGITLPFDLYRIQSKDSTISAEHLYWLDLPRLGSGELMEDEARDERRWYRKLCHGKVQELNGVIWCSVPFPRPLDWSAILKSIEVERLWSLPPQNSLGDPPCAVVDGVGVAIELVQGDRYRHVVYWNPGECCPWKECDVANHVLKVCNGLQ